MVKLTIDIVERKYSQILTGKSLSKTIKKEELWKLTHLYMNDMFISSIGNLVIYKSLKVIYLQNNNISKIKNLDFACNLTHLYLQHNAITKMENLGSLQNLQKLYLGHNNIIVVEGLENINKLQELHIENQKIPLGESLCFEPRSAFTLSNCVKVLNISNNKMTSLRSLTGFHELNILEAKNNVIDNIDDLTTTISTLTSLENLFLQGNPVTWLHRYRENLIANSVSLANLDGKIVTDICRKFMTRFKTKKHSQRMKKTTKIPLGDDITSTSTIVIVHLDRNNSYKIAIIDKKLVLDSLNLPPAFKRSISRAIFQYPGPQLSITIAPGSVGSQQQVFPSWKSASGIRSTKDNHITPRPFWSNVTRSNESRLTRSLVDNKTIALPLI